MSMGGSMGALGGDISTLSFNPAGIAVFKKTELSISPSIVSQSTSSDYLKANDFDRKVNFNISNIGLVASFKIKDTTSGWQNINFGFAYSRTNNFQNRISIQGTNTSSSLLDTYVAEANGHDSSSFNDFSTALAWNTFLINPLAPDSNFYDHVIPHYGQLQRKSIETSGDGRNSYQLRGELQKHGLTWRYYRVCQGKIFRGIRV